jgi:hypothetical protein
LNSFIDVGVFNLETFILGHGCGFNDDVRGAQSDLVPVRHDQQFLLEQALDVLRLPRPTVPRKQTKETISFYVVAFIGWAVNVGVATLMKRLSRRASPRGSG